MKDGTKEVGKSQIMLKASGLKHARRFLRSLKKADGMNRSILRMFKRQSGEWNGREQERLVKISYEIS